MSVKLTIHSAQVISVIGPQTDRAAYKAAQEARGYVMAEIHAAGRIDTGRMVGGMQVRKIASRGVIGRYEVSSSAPYTMFQNKGTRAHGPRTKPFLVFTPKGGSGVVFAKWVRGVSGAHFMEKAVMRVRIKDFM